MKGPLLVAACVAAASVGVAGQDKPIEKRESASVTATIEAIDRSARQVTLKTPDGRLVTTDVGPEVKRFDALQVGDQVTVTYYESVVLQVEKPGDPAFTTGTTGTLTPAPGEKPGGKYERQRRATVTIEEILRDPPSMTVKGEQGRVLSFRIADPKLLDRLKKGDRINVTYTEAMLVKVDKAPK